MNHENRLQLAQNIIRLMNNALELDPAAIHVLTETRVLCNKALSNHSTIQVRKLPGCTNTGAAVATEEYCVGLLGILNGIVGIDDTGNAYIAGEYDKASGELIRFSFNENLGKPKILGVPE